MKVSSSPALYLVLLLVACSFASPMFGTGGMMKRKFPGATEMSYRTYREIANSNAAAASGVTARTGGAAVAPRIGGSGSGDTAWMFGNVLTTPSSLTSSNQPGSLTQTGLSFNQQQPSINHKQESNNQQGQLFYPQDSHDTFRGRYPLVWDPQDSYGFLQFPYHAPTPLDYDDAFVPQKKIYGNYY